MKHSRSIGLLLSLLPLSGCGAFILEGGPLFGGGARFHAEASVAGVPSGGGMIAATGGGANGATGTLAGVPATYGSQLVEPGAEASVAVTQISLRVRINGSEAMQQLRSGTLVLAGGGFPAGATIEGGTLIATPAPDGDATGAMTILGGTVILTGGLEVPVTRGTVTVSASMGGGLALAGNITVSVRVNAPVAAPTVGVVGVAPGSATVADGRVAVIDAPVVTSTGPVVATGGHGGASVAVTGSAGHMVRADGSVSVRVSVRGIRLPGERATVSGGEIRVVGLPPGVATTVIDGELRLAEGASLRAGGGSCAVSSGTITVGDASGRRFRVEVSAGRLETGAAHPGNGRTRHDAPLTGGELRASVIVDLGGGFANGVIVPIAPEPTGPSARQSAALDMLLREAVPGSREAVRLLGAVQLVRTRTRDATPTLYTTALTGHSVVIVLDVSFSMSDPDPAGMAYGANNRTYPTKLDVARAELVKFLAALPRDVTANIVAFSSANNALWATPRVIDEAALREAIHWIAGLRVVDETRPVEALQAATAAPIDQVVMVTDGRPTYQSTERALISLAATLPTQHMRLDVVGVGADQDASFITQLALAGGGTSRQN